MLAAHGSVDPRYGDVIDGIAELVAQSRTGVEVRVGYLDHGVSIESVTDAGVIVVPLMLTSGYHVRSDIPARAAGTIARAIGPDPRLVTILRERLRDAGWNREQPLVIAATGSTDPNALADVHRTARDLGDELGLDVTAAFLSDGEPQLADVAATAVATYLLAPGRFSDRAAASGATIVADPLGAHPLVASIILDRYDAAIAKLA